jgi:hypothetical protein
MSDETNDDSWANTGTPGAAAATPASFCQDCGRPLTPDTVRNVGTGVFCEPCLNARVGVPPPVAGDASPVLAGFLGIIPGVGAMYNGQYAKGFVHLAIFAVLASLKDNVHGVFGLLEFGWWFYQIFDAYQTAKARRDGMPLPNPLGLNDIGERLGFRSTPAGATTARPSYAYTPPPPTAAGSGWVGYVPPTAFAGAPPVPPVDPSAAAAAQQAPAWGHAPYAQTYTGGVPPAAPSYAAVPPVAPVIPTAPLPPVRRLPIGAFWLIGVGLLILLANLLPEWHIGGRWIVPALLAVLAGWIVTRRMQTGTLNVCTLRWPVMLAVLAVLFILQDAYVLTLGQTWPVLFIAFGALLLLERAAATPALPYSAPISVVPSETPTSEEAAAQARAAWAAQDAPSESDATKGGR